jgi:hypothetical protein
MLVKIKPDNCTTPKSFCHRCLHRFVQDPAGLGHYCPTMSTEPDGADYISLEVTYQGQTITVRMTSEVRDLIARQGWDAFNTRIP